jgi:hypothetical protein
MDPVRGDFLEIHYCFLSTVFNRFILSQYLDSTENRTIVEQLLSPSVRLLTLLHNYTYGPNRTESMG